MPPLEKSSITGTDVTRINQQIDHYVKLREIIRNPRARTIRLNTELVKKPRGCREYIVVHELNHLLGPTHNARFTALMDRSMPNWQQHRDQLNQLPVRHEEWVC